MPPKKRKDEEQVDSDVKKKKKKQDLHREDEGEGEEAESDASVISPPDISGELLFCGGTNWDLIGRKTVPKGVKNTGGRNLWEPHRIKALKGTKIRTVSSGCTACHSVVVNTEGKAYSWGRNDRSQLGHGDSQRRDVPTLIESLTGLNIVDVACGKGHSILLSDRGHAFAVGDNKMGQLGLGHQNAIVPSPTKIQYAGPAIRRVACGAEFSVIVDVRGNIFSFGCPEYGQLGNNTDGKYFVSSNKLQYSCECRPRKIHVFFEKSREGHVTPVTDVEVVDVACGTNHTIITDRQKRVFTWGFGGYGRLGHGEQKDEWVPRLLKFFDGPNKSCVNIAAGSMFTIAVSEMGALYLWGKNSRTGEANMYPKPVHDLSGWKVRCMACCNLSIFLTADDSVVSWGCSPTYGELGYGANKPHSSSTPQEVKTLSGIHIHQVACGYGHTLMIARADTDQDRENLDKLSELEP